MTICSAVLIQYQRVTDRQTDRQTDGQNCYINKNCFRSQAFSAVKQVMISRKQCKIDTSHNVIEGQMGKNKNVFSKSV